MDIEHSTEHSISLLTICLLCIILLAGCSTAQRSSHAKEEALEYLKIGGKHYSDGDYQKAARYYEMAIRTMPELADAHFNLGITHEQLNNDNAAVASYRKSISLHPENATAFYNIGVIHAKRGDYQAARDSFTEAARLQPDYAEAQYGIGWASGELGEFEHALSAYKKAVELNPYFPPAYSALGNIYVMQNDRASALQVYEILREIDISRAENLLNAINAK